MTTGTRNLIGKPSDSSALFFQFLLNYFSNMYFVVLHKKSVEFIPCSNTRGSTPYPSNKFSTPYQIRHLQLVLDRLPRQNGDLMELWCSRTATSAINIQLCLSNYLFFFCLHHIIQQIYLYGLIQHKAITSLPPAARRRHYRSSRGGNKGL